MEIGVSRMNMIWQDTFIGGYYLDYDGGMLVISGMLLVITGGSVHHVGGSGRSRHNAPVILYVWVIGNAEINKETEKNYHGMK